jgi:hypothetical protein
VQSEVFVDATADCGLDSWYFNGMTGELYMPEIMGAGGALLDYDNDGDLDLFAVQGGLLGPGKTMEDALMPPPSGLPLTDRLFRNDLTVHDDGSRSVRFTDVTESVGIHADGYGMGAMSGDVNNDGFPDLFITNLGPNQLWVSNGNGTFRNREDVLHDTASWSVSAAFLDFDRDGWLDLFVANYVEFDFYSVRECHSPAGKRDYCAPSVYRPAANRLLRNRGDGTFEDVSSTSGIAGERSNSLGVVTGDFDADGWIDLYVANDQMPNELWLNNGDGTFRNDGLFSGTATNWDGKSESSMGVDVADFDGDGDEDIFCCNMAQETNTLYVNGGGGLFSDFSPDSGLSMASWDWTCYGTLFVDVDLDTWVDLLAVNGAMELREDLSRQGDVYPLREPNQLFRNRGGGRFEEVAPHHGSVFEQVDASRGAARGDIDNDGDTDVVIFNSNGPSRVWLNALTPRPPWIGLRLVGDRYPRDMLGAWVTVFRDGRRALRGRVRTDGSYASGNDPRLLFALGDAQAIQRILVTWPDGTSEEWTGTGINRYTTLRQGGGRTGEE